MSAYAIPLSGNLRTGANRLSAVVLRALLLAAVFGPPLALACARIVAAPASPFSWLRLGVSVGALAIVARARRHELLRRALLAFALESASSVAVFLCVDVPYVRGHAERFAVVVSAGYHGATGRDILADLRKLQSRR